MTKAFLLVTCCAIAATPVAPSAAQAPVDPKVLQSEVSGAEIEASLHALDVDRTAGSAGERAAADYLVRRLTELGIRHVRYDSRMFLSWPGPATLAISGLAPVAGKTAVFAAATPREGVSGVLLFGPRVTRRADGTLALGDEARGRIPVVEGLADTEALVLAGQRAGALAVVRIDETDVLHEDTVTTIWGTPTTESAARLPAIPYICLTRSDGQRVKAAAASGSVTARLQADVSRGWRVEPLVVADVPGRSDDFVLVTTHVDAWYRGMTDTAGSVASILEMARVLARHQGELERGVRFGWWTGHSFGRYAGSAWYVDRFWADLDRHAVAQTNLDGPGRRGSLIGQVEAEGWPGLDAYARESAERLTGRKPAAPSGSRIFRPGRDSDSAYQGLGVPFFSVGVPGPPGGHPDVDPTGRITYWHAPDDTIDKFDLRALAVDTQYRVAQLYDLATRPLLPHTLAPIAGAYRAVLAELALAAGSAFDLSSVAKAAADLEDAARRFDASPRPAGQPGVDRFNRLVVAVTHRLNSALYSRAGRFDQDAAAEMPVLPLLARVRELPNLPRESDEFGFLETELLRGRNAVEWTLREATETLNGYLASAAR